MILVDPPMLKDYFVRAAYLQALAFFQCPHEVSGVKKTAVGAGV
jgi:hypothetical protein